MPHPHPLPTPSNPSARGTTYHGSRIILAPASTVWATLLDFPAYHQWNTFTPRISFPDATSHPLQVGDTGELDTYLSGQPESGVKPRVTHLQISRIETPSAKSTRGGQEGGGGGGEEGGVEAGTEAGTEAEAPEGAKYMLAWKATDFPTWSLRAERVQEVRVLPRGEDGSERCEYAGWDTQAGPLASSVRWMVGASLDRAFEACAAGLKEYVEGRVGKGGGDGEG